MKVSDQLEQKKTAAVQEMRAMVDAAKAAGSSLTADQNTKLTELRTNIEGLESEIKNARFLEEQEREAASAEALRMEKQRKIDKLARGGGESKDRRTVISEYRFIDAIRAQLPHGKLEGLTKEMHEEALKEARQSGGSVNISGVAVPQFFINPEKRDLVVGTATAGGNTVATDLTGFIGPLRPQLKVIGLGAQVLSGLVGNVDIPRQTAASSAVWEGENDANAESDAAFDKVSLSPNRLGAFTEVSKQLIAQSSIGIEQLVRNDLQTAIKIALDAAAINGSGAGNEPEGILNVTGIGDVPIGTNGGAPTRTHLVNLLKEIAVDNADVGDLAFLSNPNVMAKLMTTLVDAGSGQFVLNEGSGSLIGYNAEFSTQVPNNLSKGASSGTLSAIIFGYWRDLLIGQWAGVDLVVDPYTRSKEALISLVVNSWWDTAVRHPESFAAILDADPA